MRKHLGLTSLLVFMSLSVSACFGTSSVVSSSSVSSSESTVSSSTVTLSTITFAGVDDIELEFEASFNALTGVTATGNDGKSYTDDIVLQSTSSAVNLTTGAIDTTKTGVHAIRYNVSVGTVLAQKWRNVTVKAPEAEEGEMLVNPKFDQGTSGWDDAANGLYIADGAALTLSNDEGTLKAEVVAGSNVYTPRFGQMNVPFEQGKTYKVSFDAKSSVEKAINLQVGELISSAPWFIDFKPNQTEHATITTEWANYSYKFTHTLDNKRGGVLFELGKLGESKIDATMWFDNIKVEESTADVDTKAPDFTGIKTSVSLQVGGTYDPLAGITAYDLTDGDVTDEIVVEITNSDDEVIESIDTSIEGTYTVTYTVEDSLGNKGTATTTVTVSALLFKAENLVENGSFTADLNETPEWAMWSQDWDDWAPKPVVTNTLDKAAGTYTVTNTGGGIASWAIQLFQDGYITLEEGKTYRLSVTGSSTVERSISVALGYGSWVEYARLNGMVIKTTSSTSDFIFTVTKATHDVKLVLELGQQTGYVDSSLVFEEIKLQELDAEALLPAFDLSGWRTFANTWEGSVISGEIVDGAYVVTVSKYVNDANSWHLQFIQDKVSMGLAADSTDGILSLIANTSYTLTFDAYASEAMTIAPMVYSVNDYNFLIQAPNNTVNLTTEKQTFTIPFTTGATVHGNEILKFEFGKAFGPFDGPAKTLTFDNISIKQGETAIGSVINGNFETVLGGYSYENAGAGQGSMTLTSEGIEIDVTTIGGEAYTPHFYYMIDNLAAGTYTLVLRMTSSEDRNIRLNFVLPNAGWGSILEGGKYDETLVKDVEKEIKITFTVANALEDVKFELDLGNLGEGSGPATYVISDIILYPVLA